jgi:hypothetical protein
MFNSVLVEIMNKPKDVELNSIIFTDPDPFVPSSSMVDVDIQNVFTCNPFSPSANVNFTGNGYLEFSNIQLDYCPALLHP